MLYLLGLSYGAVSLLLEALGAYLCKSRVYDAVQTAAERVPGLKRQSVFEHIRTPAIGGDLTSVKCNGRWLPLGLVVDDIQGLVLTVDELSGEDAETLQDWIAPIAESVGAELLVTDDADGFKTVAEELGLEHQVCKSHVKRNTDELIASLQSAITQGTDSSLAALGITPEQAWADLQRLGALIQTRQPEEQAELETLHDHYQGATPPSKGKSASLAYRLHLLFLDRWNLWPLLTRYRTWRGPNGETIDGTNNACERGIGWWIKERYRTMRGYKRVKSAVNVSRLLAFCGNFLARGGVDLALDRRLIQQTVRQLRVYLCLTKLRTVTQNQWWRIWQLFTGARDLVISISGYEFKPDAAEVKGGLVIPDVMPEDVSKLEEIVFPLKK